jgi:hypothetical protein
LNYVEPLTTAAEPLMDAHGTQGFHGTPVEKHWSKPRNKRLKLLDRKKARKMPKQINPSLYFSLTRFLSSEFFSDCRYRKDDTFCQEWQKRDRRSYDSPANITFLKTKEMNPNSACLEYCSLKNLFFLYLLNKNWFNANIKYEYIFKLKNLCEVCT